MPKKHTKRNFKGGYLDISQSLTDFGNSIKMGASNMWNKTKNEFSKLASNTQTNSYQPTSSYQAPPQYQPPAPYQQTSSYGGSKRRVIKMRKSRRMRGGYKASQSIYGLAAEAAPVHGLQTARAHNWVGGRKKRRTKRRVRH